MSDDLIRTWAPDDFWQVAQPLTPFQHSGRSPPELPTLARTAASSAS